MKDITTGLQQGRLTVTGIRNDVTLKGRAVCFIGLKCTCGNEFTVTMQSFVTMEMCKECKKKDSKNKQIHVDRNYNTKKQLNLIQSLESEALSHKTSYIAAMKLVSRMNEETTNFLKLN